MVDQGLDILALEVALADALGQDDGAFVAPAELQEEAIPHMAFLVGPRGAVRVGPGEDFVVGPSREGAFLQVGILDAEEAAAAAVENEELGVAEVGLVGARQLAG